MEIIMKKSDKTNAMRILDRMKVQYESHMYEQDSSMSGEEIAGILGENATQVFKTLVTQGKSGQNYVFVIPVNAELDLKKAAKVASEKSIHMIKQKELLPLTGYVHGGCSPVGMKKAFPTFLHMSAETFERIYVSGGRLGCQIELSWQDLQKATGLTLADLV